MRLLCRDRSYRLSCAFISLASFVTWSMASVMPLTAHGGELPLGLATGSNEAQITLDGKQWATLGSASTPVFGETMLRTGNGSASALLKDGTQLEVQPRSVIAISGSSLAILVKIAVGRVLFRLPDSSATVFVTPGARYEATAAALMKSQVPIRVAATAANPSRFDQVGEITVTQRGGSRAGLVQGKVIARPLNDSGLYVIKTGQSVYLPQVGAGDPSFTTLLAQALPGEASTRPVETVPVYDQPGRSLGFCRLDGSFISAPGITHNLSSPVPASKIPPSVLTSADAPPLFRADPEYVGYLRGNDLTETDPPRCDCPIPVYDLPGRSIGYIDNDGSFVSSPAYAPDRTTPVPAGTIPPGVTIPPDGRPVFTVEPGYIGYLLRDDRLRDYKLTLATTLRCRAPAAFLTVAGAPPPVGAAVGIGLPVTLLFLGGGIAAAVLLQAAPPASPFIPQ